MVISERFRGGDTITWVSLSLSSKVGVRNLDSYQKNETRFVVSFSTAWCNDVMHGKSSVKQGGQ